MKTNDAPEGYKFHPWKFVRQEDGTVHQICSDPECAIDAGPIKLCGIGGSPYGPCSDEDYYAIVPERILVVK